MNTTNFNKILNTDLTGFINYFAPVLLGLLIIIWIISRQIRPRLVTTRLTTYYILMAIGAVEIFQTIQQQGLSINFIIEFIVYSLLLPPFFGWLRVLTYRYWLNDKRQVMRCGNWLTALLWILYMLGHFVLDYFVKAPGSLFLLFDIGFSLVVQRQLAYHNAGQKFPNDIKNNKGVKE